MKVLAKRLEDDSVERFLRENYSKVPYSRPFAAKEYIDLLSWENVLQVYSCGSSRFKIVKDFMICHDPFRGSQEELFAFYLGTHSIVIRHTERSHPVLAELADDFSHGFNSAVDIQSFLTPENAETFGWHYDVENVFIIQTSGEKNIF